MLRPKWTENQQAGAVTEVMSLPGEPRDVNWTRRSEPGGRLMSDIIGRLSVGSDLPNDSAGMLAVLYFSCTEAS